MYFANHDHVMYSLNKERMLTFDRDAYLVEKDDFPLYEEKFEVLNESSIEQKTGMKYFLMTDKNGHIAIIEEGSSKRIPELLQPPFDLLELEDELRKLDSCKLAAMLPNVKDPDETKFVAESIKIHMDHLLVTKYGQVFLIASCIYSGLESKNSIFDGTIIDEKD